MPYAARSLCGSARAANGVEVLRDVLRSTRGGSASIDRWMAARELGSPELGLPTGIRFKAERGEQACLEWQVSPSALRDADAVTLQAVVITDAAEGPLGIRVNVFLEDERWRAFASPVEAGSVDGHANKVHRGVELDVETTGSEGGVVLRVRLPRGALGSSGGGPALCFPSASEKVMGQLFRLFAGGDFVDELSRMVRTCCSGEVCLG